MNDNFERKVHSAAVAGWRTVLVAAAVVVLQWVAYHVVMSSRLALVLSLWGSESWSEVQHLWLLGTVVLKILLFVLALLCLWLTLWASQLRKGRGAIEKAE
jgi:hypothetical protein